MRPPSTVSQRPAKAPVSPGESDTREAPCVVVDGSGTYSGAQGFDHFEGISAQSAGARRPHLHEHHETAIYVLSGRSDPDEQESVVLLDEHDRRTGSQP